MKSSIARRAVIAMLVVALGLICAMAVVSSTTARVHADELDHVAAARFYETHWLPPPVADPRTLDSYSYSGMSYLNEWDIVYLLAGKFAAVVQRIVGNEVHAYRLFNVLLFSVLVYVAWWKGHATLLLSVLLLSPQIWYVFSYFNADAFAVFLAFLAAYELTSPDSAFNDRARALVARYWRLGLYIGLLVLSKRTFWIFAVFVLAYVALLEMWYRGHGGWRAGLRRMAVLAAIACAVALPRVCYDFYVNGSPSHKFDKMIAASALYADDDFKPAVIGSRPHSAGVRLKSRGVGFYEAINGFWGPWFWVTQSVATSFGVYYYLLVYASLGFYVAAFSCIMLLVGTVLASTVRFGSSHDVTVCWLAGACGAAIVGLSMYHSWTIDFQPQGRYLFALFPILGILLMRGRTYLNGRVTAGLVGASFVLSTYSFVFVGLVSIPKSWEHVQSPKHPALSLERDWRKAR